MRMEDWALLLPGDERYEMEPKRVSVPGGFRPSSRCLVPESCHSADFTSKHLNLHLMVLGGQAPHGLSG